MDLDRRMDRLRRRILATVSMILLGALSGCSAISDWVESQAQQNKEQFPRLCKTFELINHDDVAHNFNILIERDGKIMEWWSSEEVPPGRNVAVELGPWHWERGQYVIYGSYDDYQSYSRNDLSSKALEKDEACVLVNVRVTESGQVPIITSIKGKNEYSTKKEVGNETS